MTLLEVEFGAINRSFNGALFSLVNSLTSKFKLKFTITDSVASIDEILTLFLNFILVRTHKVCRLRTAHSAVKSYSLTNPARSN